MFLFDPPRHGGRGPWNGPSETAVEAFGVPRWNVAELIGHPLRNFWWKIERFRSGHGAMTA